MKTPILISDITTDWLDSVFDNFQLVECGNQAVGFVDEKPVYVSWSPNGNEITWKCVSETSAKEVEGRLNFFEDVLSECYITDKIVIIPDKVVTQRFYNK